MKADTHYSDGFLPIARDDARVLILGSLPGVRSLQAAEYYAHPRNAFWRIMADINGASGDYETRCDCLIEYGIAVWDVLAGSVRPGSLDADIDMATAQVNDFADFFAQYRMIDRICFNGQKAEKIFRSRVMSDNSYDDYRLLTLPSTSPAHAAMSFENKLDRWRAGLDISAKGNQE